MTTPIVSTSQLQPDGIWGFRKAILSALSAFVALLVTAIADGTITGAEWKEAAIGGAAAGLAAFGFSNKIKPTPPAPVDPPPADGGPVVGGV